MRLVSFLKNQEFRIGALIDDRVLDLNAACPDLPGEMIHFLKMKNEGKSKAQAAIFESKKEYLLTTAEIQFLPVVTNPEKILCIGHNYKGHLGIGKTELPDAPNFFCKTANALIGHLENIQLTPVTTQLDYEAELAVIIGCSGKNIPEHVAQQYIAGYCIFNDVSARDIQKRTSQWFLGKSMDTFGPLGPALVTPDEIPDPQNLRFDLKVNGEVKQHSNTNDLVFAIPWLIHYLSEMMTLKVGDVIATGTPAKLPQASNPQQFLKKGDVVEIQFEHLGKLINPIE